MMPSSRVTDSQIWIAWMNIVSLCGLTFITLRPRQNGRHFPNDTFKCIFLNENIYISINISLKFVPKVQINNIPTLVSIMAWHRPVDKPLSEAMMVRLPTHICVSRPQWVICPRAKADITCNEIVSGFYRYHVFLIAKHKMHFNVALYVNRSPSEINRIYWNESISSWANSQWRMY